MYADAWLTQSLFQLDVALACYSQQYLLTHIKLVWVLGLRVDKLVNNNAHRHMITEAHDYKQITKFLTILFV